MQILSHARGMTRAMVLGAIVAAALPCVAQEVAAPEVDGWVVEMQAATLGDTGLAIDHPLGWRRGGMYGSNLLISVLGGTGMYPNFNAFLEEVRGPDPTAMIVEAFDDLVRILPAAEVAEASWTTTNGVHAHRSIISWDSQAGRLKALRLFVPVSDGVAILTWVAEQDLFDELSELFSQCAETLRPTADPG